MKLILAIAIACLSGCTQLKEVDRTYSFIYRSPDGDEVGGSVRLAPPQK